MVRVVMYFNNMTPEDRRKRARKYVAKCRAKMSLDAKRHRNQRYCRSWDGWIKSKTYASAYEDRRKGRSNNLVWEYVDELFKAQDGRCLFSGVELTHDKSLFSMSIDRVDNQLGHIAGNIQIVCMGVNLAKNRHANDDAIELVKAIRGEADFKPQKVSRDYISSCVRNGIQADATKHRGNDIDNADFILGLLDQQGGKCYFTGVPLACYHHPCFSVSMDRIDNQLGHIKGNVRLVLKSMNRAKGTRTDIEFIKWLDMVKLGDLKCG